MVEKSTMHAYSRNKYFQHLNKQTPQTWKHYYRDRWKAAHTESETTYANAFYCVKYSKIYSTNTTQMGEWVEKEIEIIVLCVSVLSQFPFSFS